MVIPPPPRNQKELLLQISKLKRSILTKRILITVVLIVGSFFGISLFIYL